MADYQATTAKNETLSTKGNYKTFAGGQAIGGSNTGNSTPTATQTIGQLFP